MKVGSITHNRNLSVESKGSKEKANFSDSFNLARRAKTKEELEDKKQEKDLYISLSDTLNKDNYKILLNNSRDPFKKYFTMFDIKNILKENVNYEISSEFYIKNIDTYIMNGSIITLDKKASGTFNKDYTTMTRLAVDLMSVEKRVAHEEN